MIGETKIIDWHLRELRRKSIIPHSNYDKKAFEEYRLQVRSVFPKEARVTFSPAEERLLFAISYIQKPKDLISIGTFHAYAIAWVLPNLQSQAYLNDPDKQSLSQAKHYLTALRLHNKTIFLPGRYKVCTILPKVDFLWLDEEGIDHPLHKEIYGPITAMLAPNLCTGGILAAHNVYPRPLEGLVSKTGDFSSHIQRHFSTTYYALTRNGVAIAKK